MVSQCVDANTRARDDKPSIHGCPGSSGETELGVFCFPMHSCLCCCAVSMCLDRKRSLGWGCALSMCLLLELPAALTWLCSLFPLLSDLLPRAFLSPHMALPSIYGDNPRCLRLPHPQFWVITEFRWRICCQVDLESAAASPPVTLRLSLSDRKPNVIVAKQDGITLFS